MTRVMRRGLNGAGFVKASLSLRSGHSMLKRESRRGGEVMDSRVGSVVWQEP